MFENCTIQMWKCVNCFTRFLLIDTYFVVIILLLFIYSHHKLLKYFVEHNGWFRRFPSEKCIYFDVWMICWLNPKIPLMGRLITIIITLIFLLIMSLETLIFSSFFSWESLKAFPANDLDLGSLLTNYPFMLCNSRWWISALM